MQMVAKDEMLSIARQDSDFNFLCQRLEMAERIINLPLETLKNIESEDWYLEYWKMVNKGQLHNKYQWQDDKFIWQIFHRAHLESNPIRRQYYFLAMLLFEKFNNVLRAFINKKFWSNQLQLDYEAFDSFDKLLHRGMYPYRELIINYNQNIKNYLNEKYAGFINRWKNIDFDRMQFERTKQNDIFFFWAQGKENMPFMVRLCYNSLCKNAKGGG